MTATDVSPAPDVPMQDLPAAAPVSAVFVRPGDKLVLAVTHTNVQAAMDLKRDLAEKMPGVEIVIIGGVGSIVVYRED
jgi:hypothetical protein